MHPYNSYITKFRLSDHNLPIERGRYLKPKLPREERICPMCKSGIGNEIHALFLCKSPLLSDLKHKYLKLMCDISSQINMLPDNEKLLYLLKGSDLEVTPILGKWLCEINNAYRNHPNIMA